MSPTILVVVGVTTVVLGVVLLLDRVALGMLRPARRPAGREPDALGLDFVEWTVAGEPPLEAWEIRGRDPEGPILILAHGWGANASVVLPLARAAVRHAARIVAFDVRGHGRSEDASRVSLRQFRDDTLHVARAVADRAAHRDRGSSPVVICGHSMGGAAAVLAAGEGAPVAGIVLVAAPCDIFATVARYLTEKGLPGHLLVPLTRPFFRLRVGLPERVLSPARVLPQLDVPVCVIQPAEDTRVPPSEGRRMAELAGTPLHLVQGAAHTSVLEHPETHEILRAFLGRVRDRRAEAD